MLITEERYNKYLEEINDLMDKDPDPSTPEGERIFLLALALKEYESKNFSFYKPTAVEAIRFRMEEQNLKQKDLIPYIGSKSKVSELLSGKGKCNLTVSMIRKLNQYLGIPLAVLVQETKESVSKINLEEGGWQNFPFKEMAKRGWISLSKKIFNAEEVMADFLKPIGGASLKAVMWRRSLHSREEEKGSNKYELMTWVAKVMILAEEIKVKTYDKKAITKEYLRDLAKLSRFANGPLLAKEMLEQNGIKLIFLERLSKTKVDGGCFLDRQGHPVIGMTLRYDRLDNFWHTLLHEMAHVYKHLDGENQFIDNLDSLNSDDPFEKEADDLASEALIPEASWKKRDNLRSSVAIEVFAKQLNIHPAIVAGRIRFETKNYAKFGKLVGQGQLRKLVEEHLQF
jgi:HTH-type transcriptional regulator/antitoxin HigA